MPVSSFAPEMLELFKKAATEAVLLKVGDKKKAIHLRYRFHNLRKIMRETEHSLVNIANSVTFSITPEFDLKCYPADSQYLDYLHAAGIIINPPDLPSADPMHKTERASAEEALKKFYKPK